MKRWQQAKDLKGSKSIAPSHMKEEFNSIRMSKRGNDKSHDFHNTIALRRVDLLVTISCNHSLPD